MADIRSRLVEHIPRLRRYARALTRNATHHRRRSRAGVPDESPEPDLKEAKALLDELG